MSPKPLSRGWYRGGPGTLGPRVPWDSPKRGAGAFGHIGYPGYSGARGDGRAEATTRAARVPGPSDLIDATGRGDRELVGSQETPSTVHMKNL